MFKGLKFIGAIAVIACAFSAPSLAQSSQAANCVELKTTGELQAFIAEDMQEWVKKFPDEFWFELARLEGIHYSPRSRPLRWGKYVMQFVYDAIDKDIGGKLREIKFRDHFVPLR